MFFLKVTLGILIMQAFTTINAENRAGERTENVSHLEHTVWKREPTNLFMELLIRNYPAIIQDFSNDGLRLTSLSSPRIGEHILVPVTYKHFQPFLTRCRVRYIEPFTPKKEVEGETPPKMYFIGVFFEGNSNKVHDQIDILCENLM